MTAEILKDFNRVNSYVNDVRKLADQNKGSFGFLPACAYEDLAFKGQLWVAIDNQKKISGYLIFGGTMPTLKVFQVYACAEQRQTGVARNLIGELTSHAKKNNFSSITARVASDLSSNGFWEKMGFEVYRQEKGGATTNRTINIRSLLLRENDLFGQINNTKGLAPTKPILDASTYAIDLNLLIDITKNRDGLDAVTKIIRSGLQGKYQLYVTPEFKRELKRHSNSVDDDILLRLSECFPQLEGAHDSTKLTQQLREIVFPQRNRERKESVNDRSDLEHLAHCIQGNVNAFITREKALLRASSELRRRFRIAVISPDELTADEGWNPKDTPLNADFKLKETPVSTEVKDFINSFAPQQAISNLIESKSNLRDITAYEVHFDNIRVAVFLWRKPSKANPRSIAALYIDESTPRYIAIIDHFIEISIREKNEFLYCLDLYIGEAQEHTKETLNKKGFIRSEHHYVKIVCNTFPSPKTWNALRDDISTSSGIKIPQKIPSKKELKNTGVCISDNNKVHTFSWFDFETLIGPRFIVSAERECILIPIREHYAAGLIGNIRNQLSLLDSNETLFALEKAYFRSPLKSSAFSRGTIIAFYVSHSLKEIIGLARVTYSEKMKVNDAAARFSRQGVLSIETLSEIADKSGTIHAFTFDNFIEFDKRVPFSRAKTLKLISDANLVSPELLNLRQLEVLIKEAFND